MPAAPNGSHGLDASMVRTFEDVEVNRLVVRRGADRAHVIRRPDHNIGVGADGDAAL